jgi:plastocyanin
MLMTIKSLAATLPMVALATGALTGAELSGRVVLKGTPKPEVTIDMSADPRCAALHTKPVTTRHYVVGADGGLANVFVYIKEGLKEKNFPLPTDVPVLDQKDCEYLPYVMGVRVGQKFQIRNSDPTLHNVHATPKPGGGNTEFNLAQPTKGMTTEKAFTAPEVAIRFKCDVHPWMFAYVGVLDHPFFAVTDANGNFKISGLPNGKYTIEAWHVKTHRGGAGVTKEIAVEGDTKVEFTLEPSQQ